MQKGIILIALGHEHYRRMAYTLAASIHCNEPEMPVAIVTDVPIDANFSFLFQQQWIAPEKMYKPRGRKEYLRAKLCAYGLSPFEETILLDVDQIVIPGRKLGPVFDECKDVEVSFSNTGVGTISTWVNINEIREEYPGKEFWSYHSEFIYFKKGPVAKKYFKTAQEVYDKKKLKTAFPFAGGNMADELAFQIASMITGTYPHKKNWSPNFWFGRHRKLAGKYPYQLTEFITYSIGGAAIPPQVKLNYNNLAAFYFKKLKLQNPYQAKDKRSFLPERSKI